MPLAAKPNTRMSSQCSHCTATSAGYQLGELNEWSKKTDTELAVHVPLIVRVPWMTASLGKRTTVKAELVDLYRTLADLSGLTGVHPPVEDSGVWAWGKKWVGDSAWSGARGWGWALGFENVGEGYARGAGVRVELWNAMGVYTWVWADGYV